jgi:hypothetical protein
VPTMVCGTATGLPDGRKALLPTNGVSADAGQQVPLAADVTFVAADVDLLSAAAAEGLQIDNPNQQP